MKKYEIIIDMTNDILAFWPSYYTYIRTSLLITLDQTILSEKSKFVKTQQDIISYKIIKKDTQEDVDNCFKVFNKMFKLTKRLINKAKWKSIIGNTSKKVAIVSSLDNFNKII